MTILGVQTVPGQKIRISVPVPGSAPCEAILLCGQKPGKTLVIFAGVHGCEYVGILAAQRLRQGTRPVPPVRADHPAAAYQPQWVLSCGTADYA